MEEKKVNEIMDNITKDSNLCIIREALEQYNESSTELSPSGQLEQAPRMEMCQPCFDDSDFKEHEVRIVQEFECIEINGPKVSR